MRFSFFLIPLLFLVATFFGCGGTKEATSPERSYLQYDDNATQIDGEVAFDLGQIPPNHTVIIENFLPFVPGCRVDILSSTIEPQSLRFTSSSTKGSVQVHVKLLEPCTQTSLQLEADYTDTGIVGRKIVSNTKKTTYSFVVEKPAASTAHKTIVQPSAIEITQNKEVKQITLRVLDGNNQPAGSGKVYLVYPDAVAQGIDVGSFDVGSAEVKNGETHFTYTAPNDLQKLVEQNITQTAFSFYYETERSNAAQLTVNFSPEANQTVIKEYRILFVPSQNDYTLSLDETKSFSISIIDDANQTVEDGDVIDLNVSLENTYIAELIDSSGRSGSDFSYHTNGISLTLESKTVSGLVPIHIDASFKDANGKTTVLSDVFNVIVQSGPPTAISISYASTSLDREHAKFIEHFAVSVTDKYLNPVNTNPQVSVGAIVGYAKYSDDASLANTDKRVYVDTSPLGTLSGDTFTLSGNYFDANATVDLQNDILVTFGPGYTYSASGGWEMQDYNASVITLASGQYDGNATSGLGFAIGHNVRQDACRFGDEWLGQAKVQNTAATIDESGSAIVDLTYDYYLAGKDIVLYVNIIGKDNKLNKEIKIGEARKHTLRGQGLVAGSDVTVTAEDGATAVKRFYVWLDKVDVAYRNARFTFSDVQVSGKGHINSVRSLPIESCEGGGHAYIEYNITADTNETFSVTVNKPLIANEF